MALAAVLSPNLMSATDVVRLRNALLFQAQHAQSDWTPTSIPSDFLLEPPRAGGFFADVVKQHRLAESGDDWITALSIGAHLLSGGKRASEPIQADLRTTYRVIMSEGKGYCGDYADVFLALAHASGIHARAWAFSFDGFGGHGHIFNEVWSRQLGRWVALDIQNNQYFADERGLPLSALELRRRVGANEPFQLRRVRDDVRPGFAHADKYVAYYKKGLGEWYLWWGNAVQAQEDAPWVRAAARFGRGAEQLMAVALGVHPAIRVLHEPANQGQRAALGQLRSRLKWFVAAALSALLSLAAWVVLGLGSRNQRRRLA